MSGLTVLVLLAAGACAGWWAACVFNYQDQRTLDDFKRRRDKWSD